MTVYTPNIPQPGDNPSNSQDQILQNFQTLNTMYGSSGDHYPWTNTTPTEGFRHAKVTLPGLPTANPPGNALPTPGVGEGDIFAITTGSVTIPYWRRDNLAATPQYSMLPVRAFGSFTGATGATLGTAMNLSCVRTGAGLYTMTMPSGTVTGSNYSVLLTIENLLGTRLLIYYGITNATTFAVQCFITTAGFADPTSFTATVLQL